MLKMGSGSKFWQFWWFTGAESFHKHIKQQLCGQYFTSLMVESRIPVVESVKYQQKKSSRKSSSASKFSVYKAQEKIDPKNRSKFRLNTCTKYVKS